MATASIFVIATFLLAAFLAEAAKPHATCEITYEKVGCFKDEKVRALPIEMINDRDSTSDNYKGYQFKWGQYKQSVHSLACRCAAEARKRGYKVFSLQFFAECWSGPGGEATYYRYGKADDNKCYQNIMNPENPHCDKANEQECVGGVWTNYVYMLKDLTPSIDKDGGYSKWSPWTSCTKTCGGGSRSRERTCTNPTPEGKGKDCSHLGPAEGTKPCAEQECPKPCTKALDIGIIIDESSSVNKHHFKVAIKFIKDLMKFFTVSPEGTHFGTIVYSTNAHVEFNMSDTRYHSYENLAARMDKIEYEGGSTYTDRALEQASNELFTVGGGDRPDKPNVLIVFTDGKTNIKSKPYMQVLVPLWRKKIRVVAVGIGDAVDMEELKYIAYFNQKYAIHVDSFDNLTEKLTLILNDSCIQAKR